MKKQSRSLLAGRLLATSSVAALVAGAQTPALAACYAGPYPFTNAATVSCVSVANTNFSGSILNNGTINPGGIAVTGSTIAGEILDTGTILGGISVDGSSTVAVSGAAIVIAGVSTFAGGISNAGLLAAQASGSAIGILLSNVSAFSGGITNSGTISTFGTAAAPGIALRGVSTFTGNITNSGTISANISGGGALALGIELTDVSTFAGSIENSGTIIGSKGIGIAATSLVGGGIVNSGIIQGTSGTAIDLSLANGPVTVQQAGGTLLGTILFSGHGDTLSGYGTVVGDISQGNATIAPTLAGTGILKIAGNLTQAGNSNTVVEVSPAAAAQLDITGNASIAGGLKIVFDPGTYTNKTYDLVHAGTLTGTYATTTFVGATPSSGTQAISYTGTDVDLTLAGVADAPTTLSTTTGVFGDAAVVAFSGFYDIDNIVFGHLDEQQFGQGADQVKTAVASTAAIQLAMNGPLQQLAQAGSQMSNSLARRGGWVRGIGSFFDADNQGAASGFSASGGGVLAGIDHPFGPAIVGIAGGYSGTNIRQNDGETGDIQTIRGMVYGHYHAAPHMLVDGIAGFAYDRIHSSRPIISLGTNATETHNGFEGNLAVQAGYVMAWQGLTLVPRIGAQYLHLSENRFSETGGSGFDLSRPPQNVDSFQPVMSVTILNPLAFDNGMRVTPSFKLSYSHELLNPDETLALTTPGGVSVPESIVTPAHNVVTLGPSATLRMNDKLNLYADYKLSIGVGKSLGQVIFAGARFAW